MRVELEISGMHCGSCAANIREELEEINGVDAVDVSFAGRSAIVDLDPNTVQLETVTARVRALGYEAVVVTTPA